jgi:hypothetical protein
MLLRREVPAQVGFTGRLKVFCKLEKRYLVLVIKLESIVPHFYHILDDWKSWPMDYLLFILLFPAVMEKR